VKPDVAARSLLGRIDDAGIEGLRIHVQTHRALVSFPRIDHPVHRLLGSTAQGLAAVNSTVLDACNWHLPASIS